MSWESFGKGMTHGFVLEFRCQDDLDYYLTEDPVHLAFSAAAKPLIEDSVVVGMHFHTPLLLISSLVITEIGGIRYPQWSPLRPLSTCSRKVQTLHWFLPLWWYHLDSSVGESRAHPLPLLNLPKAWWGSLLSKCHYLKGLQPRPVLPR